MNSPLKIAIAGLGTVGAGTVKLLAKQADLLEDRCSRPLVVTAVSARDKSKNRGISLGGAQWFDDAAEMAKTADADIVVELIGGSEGVARDVVDAAIAAKRHVVTANKALLALHGTELALAAERAGVSLAYEAAVAGGIPIVKALREGLAGNRVDRVYGILNGTCNYILTEMRETKRDFEVVLAEAQKLGYAEADPSFDVDGIDTAHKLAILTSLAFGCEVDFDGVHIEGIRHISPLDIQFAEELGYRIKLLGIARSTDHGIEQRVHPCMVLEESPVAHVDDAFNAVVADGDFVDTTVYEGRGAGEGPTASAVVADIVDIARGSMIPTFAIPAEKLVKPQRASMASHEGPYYVRLMVLDRPGVFADIAGALADHDVSMESVLQHRRAPGEAVPVVLTTHDAVEEAMRGTLEAIAGLNSVVEPPTLIRIEPL